MVDFVIGRENFSRRLAEDLGCRYREFKHEYHPDGDPKPRIAATYDEIGGKHVVLVLRGQQLPDYTRVSRNLHNFSRHIGNLAHVFEANRVDVLLPYYWLGRSDKNPKTDTDPLIRERDAGCDVGFEWLARDFKTQGASRIITFNPHFRRNGYGSFEVEGMECIALSGIPALVRYTEKLYREGLIGKDVNVVGPDGNSNSLVEEFTSKFGKNGGILPKKRMQGDYVQREGKEVLDAEGSEVIVLDDIFSTGNTNESAADRIINSKGIDCFSIHGVFPDEGFRRAANLTKGRFRRIVATDTIESDYSKASVIPEVVGFYTKDVK